MVVIDTLSVIIWSGSHADVDTDYSILLLALHVLYNSTKTFICSCGYVSM